MYLCNRNTQIRMLRDIYANNSYPDEQIILNALGKDKHKVLLTSPFFYVTNNAFICSCTYNTQGDMKPAENIIDDCPTIECLQRALISRDMYLFPKLYDALCAGMESGRLRGMDVRSKHVGLPDMLSIAYEAHFRVELYKTCTMQGYRHSYTNVCLKERAVFFQKMLKVVKSDRERNAAAAWTARQTQLVATGVFQAHDISEDAMEHGGVAFDDDAF
jgi:hypothetical protein